MNQLLLRAQGVAEPVATYRRWLKLGRQVRKGAKAKAILAPMMVNREVCDDGGNAMFGVDGKPLKYQVLVGFRDSRSIFAYSDTDGDELPPVQLPGWDADTAFAALDVERIKFAMLDGNTQGYSRIGARQVAINPTAVHPVKTLFHELGHIVCGHCDAGREISHCGVDEVEAEAVAYLDVVRNRTRCGSGRSTNHDSEAGGRRRHTVRGVGSRGS